MSRKGAEGRRYHKGWEIRFYVASEVEAGLLIDRLAVARLRAGRPYQKRPNRWIVPLYGREPVRKVLAWVDAG